MRWLSKVKLALILLLLVLFSGVVCQATKENTWSIQTVGEGVAASKNSASSAIVTDSNSYPHISFFGDADENLKYASWDGSVWNIQTVDTVGFFGVSLSLALDSEDNPHMSYYDYKNKNLKYAYWTDGNWKTRTVESKGDVGGYNSIAVDSSGNPHLCYYDFSNHCLKYAVGNGTAWDITVVDSGAGIYASLALDSSDNPRISYNDFINHDLKYARLVNNTWNIQIIESFDFGRGYFGSSSAGICTSLALDSLDNPYISYTTDSRLKLAKCNENWPFIKWEIQTIDAAKSVSSDTVIAIDSSDNPHITYTAGAYTLKHVWWTGSQWQSQVVDADTSASQSVYAPSITFDLYGNIHISYCDGANGDLKHALLANSYTVTFNQTGLPAYNGTVLSLDGVNYDASDLPLSKVWDGGSLHSYTFVSPITLANGTVYVCNSTTGLAAQPSGNVTVSRNGVIESTYVIQPKATPTPAVKASTSPSQGIAIPSSMFTVVGVLIILAVAIGVAVVLVRNRSLRLHSNPTPKSAT